MKSQKVMVSIWIKPELLKKLDKFANKAGISRSKLILNLINIGCDEIKAQSNIGIINLTLKLWKLQNKIDNLLTGAAKDIVVQEESPRGTNVSVRIDNNIIKTVDDLAAKITMTRSTFLEYVLELSITDLRILDFLHITDGVIIIQKITDAAKKRWKAAFRESEKSVKAKKESGSLSFKDR